MQFKFTYKKRGASHVDVIFSFAFFMLFVAWFFVFLRPISEPKEDYNTLSRIIERNLKSFDWEVQKVMLYLKSNITGMQPVVVALPFGWNENNTLFQDGMHFCIEDGKLFFYPKLSNKNFFYLAHSSQNSTSLPSLSINAEHSYATTENFRAEFVNAQLKNISYNNITALTNFSMAVDDTAAISDNSTFSNRKLIAKYSFSFGTINHTSFLFMNSSEIISFISSPNEHNIKLSFSLINFSNYYADNANNGILNYSESMEGTTASFSGNYIDFYDENEPNKSISFVFNKSVNMEFAVRDKILNFSASLTASNLEYEIIPHSGSYLSTINYASPYEATFSLLQNLSGISEANANASNNYAILSSGYPSSRSFYVLLSYGYKTIQIGTQKESSTDIYSKQIEDFMLYKNGTKQKCKVRINVW